MGKYIQKKAKIGIIGAGNVGTSLAVSFDKRKNIVSFLSNHYNNEIPRVSSFTDEISFFENSEIIILAVKDNKLKSLIDKLKNLDIKDKLIFHMSGFFSSEILKPLENKNIVGSFHPIFPFTKKFIKIKDKKIYADIEGSRVFIKRIKEVFKEFKNLTLFEIEKEIKPIFHFGLTLVSNYPLYIVKTGEDILSSLICNTLLKDIMDSFLKASVENYLDTGKISGPLSRGDDDIVRKELSLMEKSKYKDILNDIIKISKKIMELKDEVK